MFVDASAICAILLGEDEMADFVARLEASKSSITSPLAIYEATLALAREIPGGVPAARRFVAQFLAEARIAVIALGEAEGDRALEAFDRCGKGRHPARLNMGDCFAYACARTHGVPLLFKGDDFGRTDIAIA